MALVDDLRRYYEAQGILATRFTCCHQADCSRGSASFTGPKSAYFGEHYEDAHSLGLPRLLFVSLDSGSAGSCAEKRLPSAVWPPVTEESLGRRNRHWYRTHELAACIVNRIRGTSMKPWEAAPYFAHTNSAKCCQNKLGRGQADGRLFKNCRPYLSRELAVLRPDVIVTQGGWAWIGVSSGARELDSEGFRDESRSARGAGGVLAEHPSSREVRALQSATPPVGRFRRRDQGLRRRLGSPP